MEAYLENLKEDMAEELKGMKEYITLAEHAEKAGNHYHANKLLHMALDEYTHAEKICNMLEEEDIEPPKKDELWKEADHWADMYFNPHH